ncbi:DUF2463 domain-containing protein [Encephalitozoon intestinalis]|nr:DUF2463 domain-containing protein [Encephalitozoon intestinalis]UTX46153.1 DUF2463 domain-containing protein [Encephalitozoon intestinalis]
MSISKLHPSTNPLNQKNHAGSSLILHLSCFIPFLSIALPPLVYFVFGNLVKDSLFLRLLVFLPPFSYSAAQYFLLFLNSSLTLSSSSSLPCSILYSIFCLLLLIFAIISLLSIALGAIDDWRMDSSKIYSIIFPSLAVIPPFLLSTSCRLLLPQIFFIDSYPDVLVDLLILPLPILAILFAILSLPYHFYFLLFSLALVFTRSIRKRQRTPENSSPYAKWRLCVFILIFLSAFVVSTFMALGCQDVFTNYRNNLTLSIPN